MHHESMTSLLACWLFAVTLLCIRIFSCSAMRYNKTDRDCCYRSLLKIVSPQFGRYSEILGEILPSAFGVGQYFPNFRETISNSDLNTSHYLYGVC